METTALSLALQVPANKCTDAAANPNLISNALTVTYDVSTPVVTTITTDAYPATKTSPALISVVFSEVKSLLNSKDRIEMPIEF